MRRRVLLVLVAAMSAGFVCQGCAGRFSRENFETIYQGQPAGAVERVLGRPARKQADEWIYIRRRPHYYEARIRFADGKVMKKEHFFKPLEKRQRQ